MNSVRSKLDIKYSGQQGQLIAIVLLGLSLSAITACNKKSEAQTNEHLLPTASKINAGSSPTEDSDGDGFPDAAEITSFSDRQAFRRWFTEIAEMQFYQPSARWNADQRDCAGLVRFALREALAKHDRLWFQAMGAGYEAIAPDVRDGAMVTGPLGAKLFRTDFGSFSAEDLQQEKFSEFADARTLKNYNTEFVSRDRRQALPGDLLFYHQPWVQKFPYHVMIFIGAAQHAGEGANDWVVYHTGSSPGETGEVKKVRLAVLDQHPDKRWRPVAGNPNFIGFYRLKILQ